MNKILASLLLVLSLSTTAFAQEETRNSRRSEKPAVSETADIESNFGVEIGTGEEARRFRLFPLRGNESEPRTEEYVDPNGATPGIVAPGPSVSATPTGSRLERLGSIGDIVIPLLAALLGATAGPQAGTIVSRIWAAVRNKPAGGSTTPTTPGSNAEISIIKIAEVLQRLAPVFDALKQLNTQPVTPATPDASKIVVPQ